MEQQAAPAALPPDAASRLAEFARACKAAARAVALYPGGHPAIDDTLGRLARLTGRFAETGPFRLQVQPDTLLVAGAAAERPDPAVAELADLLHRHLIGGLTLNAGADANSWRTLLLLLARTPEDVRADGGIAHLWARAGGPGIELTEIDYAEVLREKQGAAATIAQAIAAALAGPQLELDDSAMHALLEIVGDPDKLQQLMVQLEAATAEHGVDLKVAAFLNLLRGLAEYVSRTQPDRLDATFRQMGRAAGRLTPETMISLLGQREKPAALVGSIDVVGAMVDRMPDGSVAQFVAGSVVAEHGATDRLAQAFQTLVPDMNRQRQLLAIARPEVEASDLGREESFPELWERVESMLTSYSDEAFVSKAYARELSNARTEATEVERAGNDPPERVAAWLGTVADSALRALDHQLLLDLLRIEQDALRWRDMAETAIAHADDLAGVGFFEQALQLAEAVAEQGGAHESRRPHAQAALERLGRESMIRQLSAHLRRLDDADAERFARLCHAIGPSIIPALAQVLATEQDTRTRRRLRDVLVGFGERGRGAVRELLEAPNWEVRRTAAYLLRELGGSEGLKELVPLLTDREPLVQREAVQALVLGGGERAAEIFLEALGRSEGEVRERLVSTLLALRDERTAPLLCQIVRHLDRRALPHVVLSAIEALGTFGGPDAVEALAFALHEGDWWAPLRTRRHRRAAAESLRRIGTDDALEVLRRASLHGGRGVRRAARGQLGGGA